VPATVQNWTLACEHWSHKAPAVVGLVRSLGPPVALVFCESEVRAEALTAFLAGQGLAAASLTTSASNRERARTLERVDAGRVRVLVTTDLAARGLDVPRVGLVVAFDSAANPKQYLHRAGRTGRLGGSQGAMVSLLTGPEHQLLANLHKHIHLHNALQPISIHLAADNKPSIHIVGPDEEAL
jgi:superfamily II DNA/RNA helicase